MPEIISRKQAKARGLKRYFTGRSCKNGHISERRSKCCDCIECQQVKRKFFRSIGLTQLGKPRVYEQLCGLSEAEKKARYKGRYLGRYNGRYSKKRRERDRKQRAAYLALKQLGIQI